VEIVEQAVAALPAGVSRCYFRADSACYEEKLLRHLWGEGIEFTISADMTRELRSVCMDPKLVWEHFEDRPREVVETSEVEFTPGDWPKRAPPMRYVAMRFTAKQGRLFTDGGETKYLAVVSSRTDLSSGDLVRWHWGKAGTIEHLHGVVKNDLGGGFVPSRRFGANAAWYRLNLITYNVLTVLKRHALPGRLREARPRRLRFEIFSVPAVLRTHARELTARLGAPPLTVEELVGARQRLLALASQWRTASGDAPA
jgi:hypothetical protein